MKFDVIYVSQILLVVHAIYLLSFLCMTGLHNIDFERNVTILFFPLSFIF